MKLQNQSRENQFIRDPHCFSPGNNTAQKSAFQASSLGLYYTLLKIHVSNVSKTSFLPHCPATPSSVFQKRTDMPMAPSWVSTTQEVNPKHSIMNFLRSNPPSDCPVLAQQLGLFLPGAAVMLRAKAVMIMNHR